MGRAEAFLRDRSRSLTFRSPPTDVRRVLGVAGLAELVDPRPATTPGDEGGGRAGGLVESSQPRGPANVGGGPRRNPTGSEPGGPRDFPKGRDGRTLTRHENHHHESARRPSEALKRRHLRSAPSPRACALRQLTTRRCWQRSRPPTTWPPSQDRSAFAPTTFSSGCTAAPACSGKRPHASSRRCKPTPMPPPPVMRSPCSTRSAR